MTILWGCGSDFAVYSYGWSPPNNPHLHILKLDMFCVFVCVCVKLEKRKFINVKVNLMSDSTNFCTRELKTLHIHPHHPPPPNQNICWFISKIQYFWFFWQDGWGGKAHVVHNNRNMSRDPTYNFWYLVYLLEYVWSKDIWFGNFLWNQPRPHNMVIYR